MKKKTKKKKTAVAPLQTTNRVENCTFYGVKWDIEAMEVLQTVAQGLTNLTELFKSQNVTINNLLNIQSSEELSSTNKKKKTKKSF